MTDDSACAQPGAAKLRRFTAIVAHAAGGYVIAAAITILGVAWGASSFRAAPQPSPRRGASSCNMSWVGAVCRWSGDGYRQIADAGYEYRPEQPSRVALFPLYPLCVRGLSAAIGLTTATAMLLVSHLCLAASILVLACYARRRFPQQTAFPGCVLLAVACYPPAFYLRMPYAEAMFLLQTSVLLLGIARRWPTWLTALIVGLATATRPVGVVLILPWVIDLIRRSSTRRSILAKLILFGPLTVSGLIGYMVFLQVQFHDALAFARTQQHFRVREAVPLMQQAWELATLSPIRETLDDAAPGFWGRQPPRSAPVFNLLLANPAYFLGCVGLVTIGWRRRWLNAVEISLAAGLIFMPYALRGHEMSMAAMGRFTCVATPVYLVMGQLLDRLKPGPRAITCSLAALVGAVYAATFAAGYTLL